MSVDPLINTYLLFGKENLPLLLVLALLGPFLAWVGKMSISCDFPVAHPLSASICFYPQRELWCKSTEYYCQYVCSWALPPDPVPIAFDRKAVSSKGILPDNSHQAIMGTASILQLSYRISLTFLPIC